MRGSPVRYAPDEMVWLEANRMMVISDYHRAFIAAFGRQDVTAEHLHALRKRKGWKVGRAPGRTAGRHTRYSEAEIVWLRDNCTLPTADYYRAFVAAFDRPDVTPEMLHSLRKRQGWKTGRTGRFAKGQTPLNKGKVCPPGVGARHPNAVATQFKKGHGRTGVAVDLYKPIGSERRSPDGYLERKIHDGMPLQSRWRAVHLIEWEALNGPIPKSHCLKSRDGDRSNTDPSNWILIERAILPALNGGRNQRRPAYDQAAPEVRPALLALAQVDRQARKLSKRGVA